MTARSCPQQMNSLRPLQPATCRVVLTVLRMCAQIVSALTKWCQSNERASRSCSVFRTGRCEVVTPLEHAYSAVRDCFSWEWQYLIRNDCLRKRVDWRAAAQAGILRPVVANGGERMVVGDEGSQARGRGAACSHGTRSHRSACRSTTKSAANSCVDYSNDPAGCQPSTFATPTGQIPSRRVGKDGQTQRQILRGGSPSGSCAASRRQLHLFRNIEPIHWVVTVPSVKDAATGDWTGGDLDAMGDARGLGIAGNCIFVGHENGLGQKHGINIFRIQPNPAKAPPVQVGEIPALAQGDRRVRRPRAALARSTPPPPARSARSSFVMAARNRSVARSSTTST